MRLLVEEYQYDATKVEDILKGIMDLRGIDGKISVNYVGYFYNPTLKDCVFILPKVVLEDKENKTESIFGKYDPHELINLDEWYKEKQKNDNDSHFHDFIYELSVWIYRSLVVFRDNLKKDGKNSDIVLEQYVQQMGNGRTAKLHTFLDVILALLRFNRENQSFFFFILRNIRSGFNKINWTRTISHSTAYIQDDTPIYIDPVNKKRQINFDEELLIIFFSILRYINERYGFPVKIDINFPLITGAKFQAYINGMGAIHLRQIKYKYFSDKAIYLWELCYAFFDRCRDITVQTTEKEYLLVKSYHVVFESIIDELIGDKNIPAGLKEQDDGKRIDHLYTYTGLTNESESDADSIYYIGDSKYYKRNNKVGTNSVYKQFTYARNVIQWNLNLFMNGEKDEDWNNFHDIKLRDDVTEGYNVIPNFFISAMLNKELNFNDELEVKNEDKPLMNRHFDNRLFDRDTLLISHYNVNFLYVISLYARNSASEKATWKEKVRKEFRRNIQQRLMADYNFSAMTPRTGVSTEEFCKEHFHEIIGKVYRPFKDKSQMMLALEKPQAGSTTSNNDELRALLEKSFIIVDYNTDDNDTEGLHIGDDPTGALKEAAKGTDRIQQPTGNGVLMVMMENFAAKSQRFLATGKIAIGLKDTDESRKIEKNIASIRYILFHTRKDEDQHLYITDAKCVIAEADKVENETYRNITTCQKYVIVSFNSLFELISSQLHSAKKGYNSNSERYDAQYAEIEELQ